MKSFNNFKIIVPIAAIVLLGLFASQPFYKKSMSALDIDFTKINKEFRTGGDDDDDEGWSFIRYKFIFPLDPKPDNPFTDISKQEALLAYYGE